MNYLGIEDLIHKFILQLVYLCGPILLLSLLIGLLVGIVQTATQIQEATLTFFPKFFAMVLCMVLFGQKAVESAVMFTDFTLSRIAYMRAD